MRRILKSKFIPRRQFPSLHCLRERKVCHVSENILSESIYLLRLFPVPPDPAHGSWFKIIMIVCYALFTSPWIHKWKSSTLSRSYSSHLTLRVWLWQALPGDEVHDGRLPRGQPERSQGHVPVQKATLVDQPEDFGGGNALVCPVWNREKKKKERVKACSLWCLTYVLRNGRVDGDIFCPLYSRSVKTAKTVTESQTSQISMQIGQGNFTNS
jgi:hypothetical protein